ncbi:MAG: hypothetical protein WBM41_14335 [Arenicellales bacterium]
MSELLIFSLLGLCCFAAIQKWWHGVWLCVAVGFLQDPVRKLIPGEPVYMVTLSAAVFAALVVGLLLRQYSFDFTRIPGWRGGVAQALVTLLLLVCVQLLFAYLNSHSLFIVALGVLTYFTPIVAILAGFYFACRVGESGIVRFMIYYCVICVLFTSGIYLEYLSIDWTVLGEVGAGLVIYDVGTVLKGHSGFFRSSEIAAWHIVLGSCFLLVLATRTRLITARALCVVGIVFLIAAGILTGRRKLIVSAIIFLTTYWLLITIYYQRSLRVAAVVVLLGMSALWITAKEYYVPDREDARYDLYVERASGVFADITERGRVLGIGAVVSAVKRYGLLGLGAGVASQGAGLDSDTNFGPIYEAEGGLGRIVVELGLIGLLVSIWLIFVFVIYVWRIIQYVSGKGGRFGYICFGLVGILLANLAHFTVASQVFSDPTILILLGLFAGMIAASPVLVNRFGMIIETEA